MNSGGDESSMVKMIKKFDAFPKTNDDFRVRTTSGAIVSIISVLLMLVLFLSEVRFYFTIEKVDHLYVNTTRVDNLKATFDVTFHEIPCNLLSVDALDDLGMPQEDVKHKMFKHKVTAEEVAKMAKGKKSPFGRFLPGFMNSNNYKEKEAFELGDTVTSEKELEGLMSDVDLKSIANTIGPCGNCFGAGYTGQCCQTCSDVRNAYATKGWRFNPQGIAQCQRENAIDNFKGEKAEDGGCKVYGFLELDRAMGEFHFAPHKTHTKATAGGGNVLSLLDFIGFTFDQFNVTHTINSLSFGNNFPGIRSPLDGTSRIVEDTHGMYQYYLKVVPTQYRYLDGRVVESNQYSVTEHMRHLAPGSGRGVPGIYFNYEVAPIQALVEERRPMTPGGLMTSICAIVGGVFSVFGIFDSVIIQSLSIFSERIL
jgi:hypothetical protein